MAIDYLFLLWYNISEKEYYAFRRQIMKVEVKTPEQQRAEILAKIPDFRLMDDTYMSAFFNGRKDLIQFILRIIMNDDRLVVKNDKTQKC